nr:peroxiredoxin-5, mitochondrial isoform X3 [Camelus dromedarius]
MSLAWFCILGSRTRPVVSRATAVECAAAAGARRCLEGGLEWAFRGVRGFRSAAAAMAPIKTHLPGFVEQAGALKAKGIQVVACLSVNDVFVTKEWGRAHNTEGKVQLLADPTGAFGKVLHGDRGWHSEVLECGARWHRPHLQPGPQHHLTALRPQAQKCSFHIPYFTYPPLGRGP